MGMGYDIGASASTAISSQSGAAQSGTGDFNVTIGAKGGGLAGLLPTVPGNQAWIVWLLVAAGILTAVWIWKKK